MTPLLGWGMALLAIVAGYLGYGWRGLVLASSVIVFWLLLQFGRSLRVMRNAAARPVGHVDSAVMLHARLHEGMALPQIMKLTGSFGLKRADEPETWAWRDGGGDEVQVELRAGKVRAWRLQREPAPE